MESFAKESITTCVGFENLYHQCKFINRRFTAKQLLLYFEQIRTTVSVGVVQSAYNAWSYCKNLFCFGSNDVSAITGNGMKSDQMFSLNDIF